MPHDSAVWGLQGLRGPRGGGCMRPDPMGVTPRAVGSLEVRAGAANGTGLGRGASWEGWGLTLVLVFWREPSWFGKILRVTRPARLKPPSCLCASHLFSGTGEGRSLCGGPKRDLPPTSLPRRQVEPDPTTRTLGRRPVSKERRPHRPDSLAGGVSDRWLLGQVWTCGCVLLE